MSGFVTLRSQSGIGYDGQVGCACVEEYGWYEGWMQQRMSQLVKQPCE